MHTSTVLCPSGRDKTIDRADSILLSTVHNVFIRAALVAYNINVVVRCYYIIVTTWKLSLPETVPAVMRQYTLALIIYSGKKRIFIAQTVNAV